LNENSIVLPLTFEGHEYEFTGRIKRCGYAFRIEIDIEGAPIYYERDEEGNWRAVMGYEDVLVNKKVEGNGEGD
jgi:hypothetical protein